jgi:uncharacterized membrane protein
MKLLPVKDYRESLLINNHKEMLTKQQLDTVKEEEIVDFLFKTKKILD